MIKLLRGDYIRLWKSTVFRLFIVVTFICTMCSIILFDSSLKSPDVLLVMDTPASVVAAICIAALIGTDYRNGTIRNKLSVGHSRISVYLSDLIVSSTAAVFLYIERILIVLAVAVPIHGELSQPLAENVLMIGVNMACILAFSAVYVLTAMLNTDMTVGAVAALLLAFGMYFATAAVYNKLEGEKYHDESGWNAELEAYRPFIRKNSYYVDLPMRSVLLLLEDTLPNGQMVQLSEAVKRQTAWQQYISDAHIERQIERQTEAGEMMLLSFAVMLTCTACGVFVFSRKDLK